MEHEAHHGSDLLIFLHALVSRDSSFPGFRGKIAVGVLDGLSTAWWHVSFLERAHAEFTESQPLDVDCSIQLSSDEAEQILSGGRIHFGPNNISGDRELLRRFLKRYLEKQSPIDARSESNMERKDRN